MRDVRRVLLLSSLLATGCGLPPWAHGAPRFPPSDVTSWAVPLYEPLTQVGPHVVGSFCGATTPGRAPLCEEVVLFVDSWSSQSALRKATFEHLHLAVTTSRGGTIEDAAGVKHVWSGARVPEVRIGGAITLHDVVASVHDGTAILGADILTARGWQIDLDQATLVLGATAWPTSGDLLAVPTRPAGVHAIVELGARGKPIPVLLDTGALVTVVERDVLRGLGLPERPLRFPFPLGGRPESARLESVFSVEVTLGGARLGERAVPALPGAGALSTHGMLGFDLLSAYAFQVTRDGGLRLRPRTAPLLATVATRIARWKDLPTCDGLPGCIAGAVVGPGEDARGRVRIVASFSRPMRFLFGCSDGRGQLEPFPLWLEVSVRNPVAGLEVETVPAASAAARQLWASRCRQLALLDINPVIEAVRPLTADVESRFVMDTRNAHLE